MKSIVIAMGCLGVILVAQLGAQDADTGKSLFEANCMVCHNADTEERKMGPGLKGLFMHDALANGDKVSEESVTKMVNEGGNGMPPFGDLLTADEKTNIVAYLKTL